VPALPPLQIYSQLNRVNSSTTATARGACTRVMSKATQAHSLRALRFIRRPAPGTHLRWRPQGDALLRLEDLARAPVRLLPPRPQVDAHLRLRRVVALLRGRVGDRRHRRRSVSVGKYFECTGRLGRYADVRGGEWVRVGSQHTLLHASTSTLRWPWRKKLNLLSSLEHRLTRRAAGRER